MNQVIMEGPVRTNKSGIAIVNGEGRILDINQRFCWLTGVSEESRGSRIFDLVADWKPSGLEEGIRMLARSSCPERLSMELMCRDHKFRADLFRLPWGDQDRLMISLTEADDTTNVEKLNWASTQNALRSRFDHDVRSRLNVILGYCAMLIEDLSMQDDADEAVEDLRCIVSAGNDLLALNRKNSDLQRLVQGNLEVNVQETYPADVLADLLKTIRGKFPRHNIVLEADDHTVRTDTDLFTRLVDTMMFRIAQEVSPESRIKVTAYRDEQSGAYRVFFACSVAARMTADREKLQNVIYQILRRTKSDSRVPDLDLFYMDTLCGLLNAGLEASFDEDSGQGAIKIELPGDDE